MCIAIVIPESWEPAQLILWATTLARAKGDDLLIVRARRPARAHDRKKNKLVVETDPSPLAVGIREHASDFKFMDLRAVPDEKAVLKKIRGMKHRRRYIFLKQFCYADLVEGVQQAIKSLRISQLIIPRKPGVRISEEEFAAERQLILEVPCETLQLRPGRRGWENGGSVLVATDGTKRDSPALELGTT